jgi:Tfp pilus assembly protein PilO
MSLDGLRAWIGVVEHKLLMRTRVFLVLVAIAVGGAGAAVYLAIEANDNAVSETELQAVRDEVAASAATTAGSDLSQLETELRALRSEVATLRNERNAGKKNSGTLQESAEGAKTK